MRALQRMVVTTAVAAALLLTSCGNRIAPATASFSTTVLTVKEFNFSMKLPVGAESVTYEMDPYPGNFTLPAFNDNSTPPSPLATIHLISPQVTGRGACMSLPDGKVTLAEIAVVSFDPHDLNLRYPALYEFAQAGGHWLILYTGGCAPSTDQEVQLEDLILEAWTTVGTSGPS